MQSRWDCSSALRDLSIPSHEDVGNDKAFKPRTPSSKILFVAARRFKYIMRRSAAQSSMDAFPGDESPGYIRVVAPRLLVTEQL
jgi:hypothetical protein